LVADHQAWSKAKAAKDDRQPRWARLQRLLAHAGGLPVAATVRPQVEAITAQRLLLAEPDPVKPLLDTLAADLRLALQQARQNVVDARERELAALQNTAEWNKLSDEKWKDIFARNGLGPIPALNIGADDLLLAALDAKSLDAWGTEALVAPTRMHQAREEAARLLEPKAVRVRPKSTTLHNVQEVDDYLDGLRTEIMAYVQEGNPVIL